MGDEARTEKAPEAEGPTAKGPYQLYIITIGMPAPGEPRASMTPDPRKPTVKKPDEATRGEIIVCLPKQPSQTAAEAFLREFVKKNRDQFPSDYSYLIREAPPAFWLVGDGVPEVSFVPCPKHPDAPEPPSNICGHCGELRDVILKTTR